MRSARSATTHSHGGTGRTARGEIRCPQPPLSISINQKGKRKPNFVVGFVFNILQNICTETKVQPKKGAGSGNEGGAARCPNPPRPYSTTYSHERTSSPPHPPKILLSSLYRAAPLKKKKKTNKSNEKGGDGGQPPSLWGDSGDPSALSPAACAPCALTGADGGVGWGGRGEGKLWGGAPQELCLSPTAGPGGGEQGGSRHSGCFPSLAQGQEPPAPPSLTSLPAGPHSILSSKPHIWPSAPRGCSAAALRLSPQRGFSFCRAAHWER